MALELGAAPVDEAPPVLELLKPVPVEEDIAVAAVLEIQPPVLEPS